MVTIINYNAGNTKSVLFALERLGVNAVITNDVNQIQKADKVILPGVGHAAYAMAELKKTGLHNIIPNLQQPVLGICLGLQLMCSFSEEGVTECLNIFNASVKKFISNTDKIPQIGWNKVQVQQNNLISKDGYAYFVHSYYAEICSDTIATTNYILPFSAAMQKNNFYACQFHPEKSSEFGEAILKQFISL
jgi:glutamine amidotransferase